MNEELITDTFRNMAAEKIFGDTEVITAVFHSGNPGPNGTNNRLGDGLGLLNLRSTDWELGDTGEIRNKDSMPVGVVTFRGFKEISYYSLLRQNGDFLGYFKLLHPLTFGAGERLQISAGLIKFKF